jgi:hypothetical protein
MKGVRTVQRFVIEAVLVATYGQLVAPARPVEYLVPYSTIVELYEMRASSDPIMTSEADEAHVRGKIGELIEFFEEALNRKKIEKALQVPWRKSAPLLAGSHISFTVVNAFEHAEYGEMFDPVETDLILTAIQEKAPILTDQLDFVEKVIEAGIPVQVFDIEDFEFALEEDWAEEPADPDLP